MNCKWNFKFNSEVRYNQLRWIFNAFTIFFGHFHLDLFFTRIFSIKLNHLRGSKCFYEYFFSTMVKNCDFTVLYKTLIHIVSVKLNSESPCCLSTTTICSPAPFTLKFHIFSTLFCSQQFFFQQTCSPYRRLFNANQWVDFSMSSHAASYSWLWIYIYL